MLVLKRMSTTACLVEFWFKIAAVHYLHHLLRGCENIQRQFPFRHGLFACACVECQVLVSGLGLNQFKVFSIFVVDEDIISILFCSDLILFGSRCDILTFLCFVTMLDLFLWRFP